RRPERPGPPAATPVRWRARRRGTRPRTAAGRRRTSGAGRAGDLQQPAERQRVRVHDPFQAAAGESECRLNARQRDVDDGRVQHDHQLRGCDDEQCQAKVAAVFPGADRADRADCGIRHNHVTDGGGQGGPLSSYAGSVFCLVSGGCGGLRGYSAGSSPKWLPAANVTAGPGGYARRMRTNQGRQRFFAAGWGISAGVMIVASRLWLLHLREVEQRADEAERTRDEAAQRRAMEERLRIARELHDSLTHSISVICVQAGVAVHLARKRGEDVPPALLAIQEAGADAARELRTTISVLRSDQDGDCSDLGQLDSLVARARAAGLPVTVTVTGT